MAPFSQELEPPRFPGRFTYAYDPFNRMQSASFNGTIGTYGYNAYGERTSKVAPAYGTFRYTYAEDHRLLAERLEATNGWTNYLWFGNELVGITKGTPLYAVHTDHLGRPEEATNNARTVVWRVANTAFGDPSSTPVNTIGGLNVGFPGQYYDQELGFWYNINRYYIGLYGRYAESDPIGLAGGIKPYVYVGDNPVNAIDPLGLCDCKNANGTPSRNNNPNMNRNIALGAVAVGAFGAAAMNVIGFPEVEIGEGVAATGLVSMGGMQGSTALELMDGLAGEPFVSRFIASFSGFAVGSLPGGLVGFGVTKPMPPPESTECP